MAVSYAKRLAYQSNARVVGLRWREYLQLIGFTAAASAVVAVLPSWPGKGLEMGVVIGAVIMVIALATYRLHDPQVRGYAAETFSIEALGKIRGWVVIDNLPFDNIDIDHVAIAPSTVLAVETKHHGHLPPSHSSAHQRARRDREDALAAARKLRSLLRSMKLHGEVTVTPMLMIWGPGAPDFAEGYRLLDGVYVVDGEHPELWRHLFAAPTLSRDVRQRVETELRTFSRRREAHERATTQRLWRTVAREFRDGVRDERAARANRRARQAAIRRRHAEVRELA